MSSEAAASAGSSATSQASLNAAQGSTSRVSRNSSVRRPRARRRLRVRRLSFQGRRLSRPSPVPLPQACDALRQQSLACQTRAKNDAERDAVCGRVIEEYKQCVKAEREALMKERRRANGME